MQVGSAYNPALNSLLAASFAQADIASAARATYFAGLSRSQSESVDTQSADIDHRINDNKRRIDQSNADGTTGTTNATEDATQKPLGNNAASQAQVYLLNQQLRLSDFQRAKVALSASDEASIFGSEDMLADNQNSDQAQRRSRFGQSNVFQFTYSTDVSGDGSVSTLNVAPQYDLELSQNGEILDFNPREDVSLGKPMAMPLIKDIDVTMGQSIQGKVAALYASNYSAVESQGAYYSMVS